MNIQPICSPKVLCDLCQMSVHVQTSVLPLVKQAKLFPPDSEDHVLAILAHCTRSLKINARYHDESFQQTPGKKQDGK